MDGSKDSPIVFFHEDGTGPDLHVCKNGGPIDRIEAWLFREKCLGMPAPEVRLIERLVEDLR